MTDTVHVMVENVNAGPFGGDIYPVKAPNLEAFRQNVIDRNGNIASYGIKGLPPLRVDSMKTTFLFVEGNAYQAYAVSCERARLPTAEQRNLSGIQIDMGELDEVLRRKASSQPSICFDNVAPEGATMPIYLLLGDDTQAKLRYLNAELAKWPDVFTVQKVLFLSWPERTLYHIVSQARITTVSMEPIELKNPFGQPLDLNKNLLRRLLPLPKAAAPTT